MQGDSFGVIVQNGGGSKIDNFLERTIRYSATVSAATGRVRAQATVVLQNTSPSTGVPLYVIGNGIGKPVGTSTLYVSIYSPFSLGKATLDGRPLSLLAERELGRNVYSSFVDIPPGGTKTITVDLGGAIDLSDAKYRFAYIAQVLPNPDRVTWSVDVTEAKVVGATAHGATPVPIDHDPRSATVTRSGARGPWSVEVRLRR